MGPADTGTAFVERHCAGCHANGKNKGNFSVERLLAQPLAPEQQDVWAKIVARVNERDMPPEDEPQPSDVERAHLADWVDGQVLRLDCQQPNPGFVVAHRLNRNEYRNTIRDLLGVDLDVSQHLPPDASGRGFDNMAASLTMSPFLLERYLAAADEVLNAVVFEPGRRYRQNRSVLADQANLHDRARLQGGGRVLLRNEQDIGFSTNMPFAARFKLTLQAATWKTPDPKVPEAQMARPTPLVLVFEVDGDEQAKVKLRSPQLRTVSAIVEVPAGPHRIRVLPRPLDLPPKASDSGAPAIPPAVEVLVTRIGIVGPLQAPIGPEGTHRALFFARPTHARDVEAARGIVRRFASQAFRRPVEDATLDRLMGAAQAAWRAGAAFEAGVRQALRAVLLSPRFLYRVGRTDSTNKIAPLDDHALAERLSYFLWSTMPDEELRALADAGLLRQHLGAQVRRMLYHPRARNLVENFGGQWLQFRLMDDVTPASFVYRRFTQAHRHAFREETALLFEHVMREDLSVMDFLTADYTFVNDVLAQHYGIEGITGPAFRRVSLQGLPRRGVLTHASTLTITSRSTRTSPVMRGKWVLDTLLDTPPPPPPPDVPELPGDDNEAGRRTVVGTLRSRLQAHRESPACSPCHERMDPIGFGLENFDGIGAYRETDNKEPVDASGQLPTGDKFQGPLELVNLLAQTKQEPFVRTFATQLLIYALGRDLRPMDRCTLDVIIQNAEAQNLRFSAFVLSIVNSVPFQYADTSWRKEDTVASDESEWVQQ